MRASARSIVLFVCLTLFGRAAFAAVYAESTDALIELAAHVTPGDRLESDFSILMWIWPEAQASGASSIFEIPGVLTLGTSAAGTVMASLTVSGADGVPTTLVADTGSRLLGQEWQIVALSFRRSGGYLDVFHGESLGVHSGSAVAGFESAPGSESAGGPRLGMGSDGRPAMLGAYGLLAFRSHPVKAGDVAGLRPTRRYFTLYDRNDTNGLMNGVAGAEWMLNHAITTLPEDIDAGGARSQRAAVMGELVGRYNIHVYDKRVAVADEYERFNQVREAVEVRGFRYKSTREGSLGGWFSVDPGDLAVVLPNVPGESSLAAQLAGHPRRPIRMMVSANSRAVFRDDGSGASPGNYAHGFFDFKRPEVAGVLFRPVVRGSDGPWFGFSCVDPPRAELTELVDTAAGTYATFSRFWTGSAKAPSLGPGSGLFLRRWGLYELRCGPEAGSLMTADEPLVVEAYVMAFPGASPLLWKPRRGIWQSEVGIDDGPSQVVGLDTTRSTHTFGSDDRVLNSTAMVLKGNFEGLILPGDAMFIETGPVAGQIAIIDNITQGITQATVTFDMPLARWPEPGVGMRFGTWRFEKIRHEFPAVSAGDPRTWRGLYLQAINEGSGFPVFAYSAWRPNVNGYIIGVAGWGGNGYALQLADSEPDAVPEWMRIADPDLWIQVPAQQNALPENMGTYTAAIRQAKPEVEIVWAAEAAHPSGDMAGWAQYISDHAAEEGVIGIIALDRNAIGTSLEQLADGHRSNLPHISRRGNLKLAELWCDQLAIVATDPCPADFAPPWHVYDFFDVQSYLSAYVRGDPVADLTGDGQIGFFDVQLFLSAFSAGCQ